MRVVSTQVLSALNNVSRTGSALDTNQLVNITFQITNTDTDAAGSVKVQGSNDNPAGNSASLVGPNQRSSFVPTNWSDIPSATSTVVAGVGPLIVVANVSCQYMRVVFTQTTPGTGTMTVQANGVGV